MALEAALLACAQDGDDGNVPVQLIEALDVDIRQGLVLDPPESSFETLFSLNVISRGKTTWDATFRYHAASGKDADHLELKASGALRVHVRQSSSSSALSDRTPRPPNLVRVHDTGFYESLLELGYQYSGPFAQLTGLWRKLGAAAACVVDTEPTDMVLHPAVLDAAFQAMFLTHSSPHDGSISALHVPRRIRRVSVNPTLCAEEMGSGASLPLDATQDKERVSSTIAGDVSIYSSDQIHALVQVEGLECVPLTRATAADDKEAFAMVQWNLAAPDTLLAMAPVMDLDILKKKEEEVLLERMAGFYLRALEHSVPADHPSRSLAPYRYLFQFAAHTITSSQSGLNPLWQPSWEHDTLADLSAAMAPFQTSITVQILSEFGTKLPKIATGDLQAIEVGMADNLLGQWYTSGLSVAPCTSILATTLHQLTHRSPSMHILEVGAGTGAATRAIFHAIGDQFASYTYTDISAGFFGAAKTATPAFEAHKEKMVFQTLDISADPGPQGFSDAAYDVVVASLVLHATPVLEATLRNVRCLLKPGGYLVSLEILAKAGASSFCGVIFGAFPGWWMGAEEGRALSPNLTLREWDALLKRTGFAGVDTSTGAHELLAPLTVWVAQAVDEKVAFLREPLVEGLPAGSTEKLIDHVVILGGGTTRTASVVGELKGLLEPHCQGSIRMALSLPDLLRMDLSPGEVILSLAELDDSVFKDIDSDTWDALRRCLLQSKTLIWVTQGRRADNPYANMMGGLARTVVREAQSLEYLLLDIENPKDLHAAVIAESTLRHVAATKWNTAGELYVTAERELVLAEHGHWEIPRLVVGHAMNKRYNSSQRAIFTRAEHGRNLGLAVSESAASGWEVVHTPLDNLSASSEKSSTVQIKTSHSLLSALRVSEFSSMFLILGRDTTSGETAIALATENTSIVSAHGDLTVVVDEEVTSTSAAKFLNLVAHHLLAAIILRGTSKGDRVLVYESDPQLAAVLLEEAKIRGVLVTFTKNSPVASLKLERVCVFVDFSTKQETNTMADRIRAGLSQFCRKESLGSLTGNKSWVASNQPFDVVKDRLNNAVCYAQRHLVSGTTKADEDSDVLAVTISSLPSSSDRLDPLSIIDWSSSSQTLVRVQPCGSQVRFSNNRTIWLVGLSGGLGLSLCEWIIRRGARHLVISSRNPCLDPAWLDEMRKLGAIIKVAACDITNQAAVATLHADITASMPPIAGVVQGAMVLHDVTIQDMTLANLITATRPKVEGSMHLASLFASNPLDFFVFLSSATSITANVGQGNYSAANWFMTTLARQRRRRGLSGSVMHIGAILGVGYITRDADKVLAFSKVAMRSGAHIATSETDFYQLFAEAVIAGRAGSKGPVEVLSGVRRVSPAEEDQPDWEKWPVMNHFVKNRDVVEMVSTGQGGRARVEVKKRLPEARSRDEVYEIIRDEALAKVCVLFEIGAEKLARDKVHQIHFDELGVDSLVAMDLRSWFMKTLEVNIPTLKILNGASLGELIDEAAATIPARLVPNLGGGDGITKQQAQPKETSSHEGSTSGRTSSPSSGHADTSVSSASSEPDQCEVDRSVPDELERSNILKSCRLSFKQSLLMSILDGLEDKTSENHVTIARITGIINPEALAVAVRIIGQQHEALRTCIVDRNGTFVQAIMEKAVLELETRTITLESEAFEAMATLRDSYLDLARGESVRLILLTLNPTTHFLAISFNPIIVDGISFQILMRDLFHAYRDPKNPFIPAHQFTEHSEKQHADHAAGRYVPELNFWLSELSPLPPHTLPLFPSLIPAGMTTTPSRTTIENERAAVILSPATTSRVRELCTRFRATPFHFYLAVLRSLITRFAPAGKADDIVVGIGEMDRSGDEWMGVIGPFTNPLPLRLRARAETAFEELVVDVRARVLAALGHSRLPMKVLLEALGLPAQATELDVHKVRIEYRVGQAFRAVFGEVRVEYLAHDGREEYDLYLDIVDDPVSGEGYHLLVTRKDLYGREEAEKLARSYEMLIEAFLREPGIEIGAVALEV